MTGFEPAASCSQSRRATKLRYIPVRFIYFFGLVLTYHQSDRAFAKALIQLYQITRLMANLFHFLQKQYILQSYTDKGFLPT